jgi:hypothetical protein
MNETAQVQMSVMASSAAGSSSDKKDKSWFEAMAEAWGKALDKQAAKIETQSAQLGEQGIDTPAAVTQLTAESLKMSFLSNSSHTAMTSVGEALGTMARKQ